MKKYLLAALILYLIANRGETQQAPRPNQSATEIHTTAPTAREESKVNSNSAVNGFLFINGITGSARSGFARNSPQSAVVSSKSF